VPQNAAILLPYLESPYRRAFKGTGVGVPSDDDVPVAVP